jgi:predicted  nucleic acid-binding Zn-ribbon protein
VPDETKLRRAFLRGYRQGDVELALARATLKEEQLELELDATKARATAMQTEITELHRRIDIFMNRERELTATLDELRQRREQMEREADSRAARILGEAEQRAAALRTEGLRQVGELQLQVEQLLGLRAGLSAALKRVTQDIADALDRLAAAPARAVEQVPPTPRAPDVTADEAEERFMRWSPDPER